MSAPLSRALALLDLLQTHRSWPAEQLCDRLGVTDRTLRRDLDRLRELGYRIDARRGTGGGYRLAAGSALPPLLLTDDEAVTVAIGLRSAATQGLTDGAQTALTALAKLEAMLPSRLRRRVSALGEHVAPLGRAAPVAPEVLSELALACRDGERVRFHYTAGDGQDSDRVVEPHSLVAAQRAWFLLAWDRDRLDWRTFRVDRLSRLVRTRARDAARRLPDADAASYVARALRTAWGRTGSTEVTVHLPIERFRQHFGAYASGATADGEGCTRWTIEGTGASHLLAALAWLPDGVGFDVQAEPAVLQGLESFAERLQSACRR